MPPDDALVYKVVGWLMLSDTPLCMCRGYSFSPEKQCFLVILKIINEINTLLNMEFTLKFK